MSELLGAEETWVTTVRELQGASALKFADWPDGGVPRRAAGVYTIWRQDNLLYAGMSGRGAQAEDFTVGSGGKPAGLWTRLNSQRLAGGQETSSTSMFATASSSRS